jgi:preprotein translocase SecE subunit
MSKQVQSRAAVQAARHPGQFLREVWLELGKVKWPSWPDVTQLTGVVLLTIISVGLFVSVMDVVFGWLFTHLGLYGK